MQVAVEYAAQSKRVAGVAQDVIQLDAPCPVAEIARLAAANHDAGRADMLFDENGHPRPSILVFKGEDQVRWDDTTIRVEDGETITLLSPVSGG